MTLSKQVVVGKEKKKTKTTKQAMSSDRFSDYKNVYTSKSEYLVAYCSSYFVFCGPKQRKKKTPTVSAAR